MNVFAMSIAHVMYINIVVSIIVIHKNRRTTQCFFSSLPHIHFDIAIYSVEANRSVDNGFCKIIIIILTINQCLRMWDFIPVQIHRGRQ